MTATDHPTFTTGALHAEAYQAMRHDPFDPHVQRSYAALATAIAGQWNGLRAAGFKFIASEEDPYTSSADMLHDVDRWFRLRVFADGGTTLPWNHPMRQAPTAWGCVGAESEGFRSMNDVFRAVHDVMGHWRAAQAGECASFGPVGEYSAWRAHYATLPAAAYSALWCETRGQNAWTNFYGANSEFELKDRPYAVQKAGNPFLPLIGLGQIINPQ